MKAEPKIFLFVSHVTEDRAAALDIVNQLERRGVKCWLAPRDVSPGRPFDDEIADAIEGCRAMLLVFSEHCNESEYIRREVTVAGECHKLVIPFRIEDAQPRRGLRVRLSDLHWIDGFVSREQALDELADALRKSGEQPASSRGDEERLDQQRQDLANLLRPGQYLHRNTSLPMQEAASVPPPAATAPPPATVVPPPATAAPPAASVVTSTQATRSKRWRIPLALGIVAAVCVTILGLFFAQQLSGTVSALKTAEKPSEVPANPQPQLTAPTATPHPSIKKYDTGASDTEIKIGNTGPYSGPASSYSSVPKAQTAYWKMINDRGGINGRKINFISYDDAYTPLKTFEMVRKLVEEDGVFLVASPLGTPINSAIWNYLNQKHVPQLFVATGAAKWDDPKGHPWTMGWQPNYQNEGRIYAAYILKEKPNAKIGVLYQNDDFGKDYLKGIKDGLGAKAWMIIAEASYETTDPTVDSQIVDMKAKGVDVFVNTAIPKFAAQAIRKAAEIEWKPLHILSSIGNSIGATLIPAGLDNAKNLVSDFYLKDPSDPRWKDDAGFKTWVAFMDKYLPDADKSDAGYVAGSSLAAMTA